MKAKNGLGYELVKFNYAKVEQGRRLAYALAATVVPWQGGWRRQGKAAGQKKVHENLIRQGECVRNPRVMRVKINKLQKINQLIYQHIHIKKKLQVLLTPATVLTPLSFARATLPVQKNNNVMRLVRPQSITLLCRIFFVHTHAHTHTHEHKGAHMLPPT